MNDPVTIQIGELEMFITMVDGLRRSVQGSRKKPHKIVLLLTVLDMAEDGLLEHNSVYFDDDLHDRFRVKFSEFSTRGDWCQLSPPYFHLRDSGLWAHKLISGSEESYSKLRTAGGGKKRIRDHIEYAYLTPFAYRLFMNAFTREAIRSHLVNLLRSEPATPADALMMRLKRLVSRIDDDGEIII